MKKTPWIAGAALAAMLAGATAFAAPDGRRDGPPPPPKTRAEVQAKIAEHFKKLDTNGDGFVTKEEAEAARTKMRAEFAEKRQERRGERFAMLDKDKNGSLSKEEYMAPPPRGDGKGPDGADGKRGRDGHGPGMHRGGRGGRHHGGPGMMGFGGGKMFERADANKDGKVSLAEAQAGPLAMFDKIDTNKDGTISPQEHEAARDAMRAKWKERRDGDKTPPAPKG